MTAESKNNHPMEIVDKIIARILAIGIVLSSSFYVIGLILFFLNPGAVDLQRYSFDGLDGFFRELGVLSPKPFLFFGTLALILTPISRVVLSIYLFARKKESKFVFITIIVASIILVSILMGIAFSLKFG